MIELLKVVYEKFYSRFVFDNRISLESAISGFPTPFEIVAKSFLDRGIWKLSPDRLINLCLGGSAILYPTYSYDRETFAFVVPITEERAGKSLRMSECELTYEAQQALYSYVASFNMIIAFQFHSVSVYENGDHYELRMVLSKNPNIVDREEILNQKERRKKEFLRTYSQRED